jgi:glycosyltransferase involved in cell wall biosynthesis
LLKRRFISKCCGYVVPGSSASSYLETFGVSRETIFVAPNAIDVDRFSGAAEKAHQEPGLRQRLELPQRYLLFVGRFVKAKGIFDLLTAYATLPEETRRDVGLVLAGDGEDAEEIRRRGAEIGCGTVVFSGFLQRDELPAVYALAEALVFPTHTDPWGLVVNEALACGLPVIASKVAGCVADLVREGENGFIVAPGDPKALARAMQEILSDPGLQGKMSNCSLQISSQFTPQAWADGVVRAMNSTMGALRG